MIVVPCVTDDGTFTLVTEAITGLAINFIINNGSDVDLSSASFSYSATAKGHKLIITAATLSGVTDTSSFKCTITGTGIRDNVLEGMIWFPQSTYATVANLTTANSNISDIKTVTDALDVPTTTEIATAVLGASIRTGRTVLQLLRIIEIILDGTVTGLTSGSGSPVTFTGVDGSTVVFTVDANGNRAISSVNLS
jgi:hypothetical protein